MLYPFLAFHKWSFFVAPATTVLVNRNSSFDKVRESRSSTHQHIDAERAKRSERIVGWRYASARHRAYSSIAPRTSLSHPTSLTVNPALVFNSDLSVQPVEVKYKVNEVTHINHPEIGREAILPLECRLPEPFQRLIEWGRHIKRSPHSQSANSLPAPPNSSNWTF